MLSLVAVVMSAPVAYELTVPSIMQAPFHIGRPPSNLRWSEDGRRVLFSWSKADGKTMVAPKTWSVDRDGTNLKELTEPEPNVRTPWDERLAINGKVAYIADNDIYIYDLNSKSPTLLKATPESETRPRLTADGKFVLYFKGSSLYRMSVDDRSEKRLIKSGTEDGDGVVLLVDGKPASNLTVSANGTHVSTPQFLPPSSNARIADVPNYITGSGYPQMIPTYARVGAPQPTGKVTFFDLRDGKGFEMAPPQPGMAGNVQWAPNGSYAIARLTSNDHEYAWIMGFDPATNEVRTLYTEHDKTWIGGPSRGTLGWLPDSSRFYFTSEENGFSNLYTMAPADTKPANLTDGPFEVSNIRLDEPRRRFIFVSSEGSPYRRHVAAVPFDGGARKKLAELSADDPATFEMSPAGDEFAVVRSLSTNRPAELFVNGKQITTTPTEAWLSGPWINPPIIEFPARDGAKVPAKLFKPKKWKRGGPAVIFIHGAGYLQNVYEGWSGYSREYMFHHVLMDKGYAVLDIDYRASAGYGKAWRTAIHRHMGGKDLDDILDGAKYLVDEVKADPKRLGVYGGSYGGFLTLMAMFTSPDTFVAGAALRPVVDWASYHHGYTAPILNTPLEDSFAYRRSSPIHHVEGLKGHLLICHGMVDTNVHFQDSVRLAQKLIELGKDNWEIAPYPVENHAFTQPESWTDEYKRILNLFERTIGNRRSK